MSTQLRQLLRDRAEVNHARGIYSVCSAHKWVLQAALRRAKADNSPLLIEATCNQVNQFGGYTGMRPATFRKLLTAMAHAESFPTDRLILGGDHLGPSPWQNLPAVQAMKLAKEMAAEYAREGFLKLHLDASMRCADDPSPLPPSVIAERAAELCAVTEKAAGQERPVYVIGTEVPTPGGATESLQALEITRPQDAEQTLQLHRDKFAMHGLAAAWDRVIALVVQPGVEFNHDSIHEYDSSRTEGLTTLLGGHAPLVFEAHSTDYQLPGAYKELVAAGFAILKVGPALTFAMRETLFALEEIERWLVPEQQHSRLQVTIEQAMLRDPSHWRQHYHGNAQEQRLLGTFSYSDRIRYYWSEPGVARATETLLHNLHLYPIPETLLSALLPDAYRSYRESRLSKDPLSLVLHGIDRALQPYSAACLPS